MRSPPSFEKVTKNCEYCGTAVTKSPSLMKGFRFCSMACRRAGQRESRECKQCGKDFSRAVSLMTKSAQFCSKDCYDAHQTKRSTFVCECCAGTFERQQSYNTGHKKRFCSSKCQHTVMVRDQHPRWKGGISIGSDGVEITLMKRPKAVSNYIRTHRKVASQAIGRLLERFECVIHINNDTNDNRPENLFICGTVSECVRRINNSLPWPKRSNLQTYA